MSQLQQRLRVPALHVKQWLTLWDEYDYNEQSHRSRPPETFYLVSMKASTLRQLSGVNRRQRSTPGPDLGIQRRHEQKRSDEIARYVKFGYPFSAMKEARRSQPDALKLRQPGWLPTAIVVNIVQAGNVYRGESVADEDLVEIDEGKERSTLLLPRTFRGASWEPTNRYPVEIIDGQHRLFAFNDSSEDFEVPVVAFSGLDIGWQAYLFWTINIKPKRINSSLAFDLYPLLRTQDWLEEGDDYTLYRETRAQELTERLWSYPSSAWYRRIDMLGDSGRRFVSQAAWVRSLVATIIKRWDGKGVAIGGLFGSKMSDDNDPLPWSQVQQAAFVISFWNDLRAAVGMLKQDWAQDLRGSKDAATRRFRTDSAGLDAAFYGPHTLINQDQGIRVLLHALNDVFFISHKDLGLEDWVDPGSNEELDNDSLDRAIETLKPMKAHKLMKQLCASLAQFDWRSSTAPGLTEEESQARRLFRGSGGYADLRRQCVQHLTLSTSSSLRAAAISVSEKLRTLH